MAIGRFVTFGTSVVLGGLLQSWVLWIVMTTRGHQLAIGEVFGDGSLFFFATSLTVTSFVQLLDTNPLRVGSIDLILTLFLPGFVFLIAVPFYSTILSETLQPVARPFETHLYPQLACVLLALSYWFFVGVRTGWFSTRRR